MRQDKKISGGKITLILMKGIGAAFSTRDIAEKDIRTVLEQELQR
jgi:3-dehydroquinate synthetase